MNLEVSLSQKDKRRRRCGRPTSATTSPSFKKFSTQSMTSASPVDSDAVRRAPAAFGRNCESCVAGRCVRAFSRAAAASSSSGSWLGLSLLLSCSGEIVMNSVRIVKSGALLAEPDANWYTVSRYVVSRMASEWWNSGQLFTHLVKK
jgi:hypothetical protein